MYGLASWLTARRAARHGDRQFVLMFMGGMVVRLFVAMALVVFVLVLFEPQVLPFVSALLFMFVTGLVLEVWSVHARRSDEASADRD